MNTEFDGNLEDADASASKVCASASRSFLEARELLSLVTSARDNVVGIGAFDGLAQPSTYRKREMSRGKGENGKKKGHIYPYNGGKSPNVGTPWNLAQNTDFTLRTSSANVKEAPTETGTTRGGPHHAPRLRPDQCMLCRLVGHRASENLELCCAVCDAMCHGAGSLATVEEVEEDLARSDIEHGVADRYDKTAIETTDVGFTLLAVKRIQQARTSGCRIPSSLTECRVVSNESTPFLTGLDVIREYGLVIDYHHNRVYSHIMKRCFPCAFLPTRHLALEMMPSKTKWRSAQRRVMPP